MNADSPDSDATASGTRGNVAIRAIFGDRLGFAVFLVAILFLGATWRLGFFIADTKTVANLVSNVADGRLAVVETPYSITAVGQPGLVESGGQLYGRNYGEVYLAVPLVWTLDVLELLLDLRLVLAGLWSLAIVTLGQTSARLFDRPWLADVGAVLAVGNIGVAVVARTPFDRYQDVVPLLALQLTTILVAAMAATLLYRLLSRMDSPRVGFAGGLALVLATPIGFWGTLPKRHVYTAAFLLLACFWFAYSRSESGRRATLARAGAYGAIGYLASIHPFEAVFMLAVLVPIDLATAGRFSVRQHAVVAMIFLLAIAPMLATNAAISGDPLSPPRTLSDASSGGLPPDISDRAGSPDATGGSSAGSAGGADGGGTADGADGDGGTTSGSADGGVPIAEWLSPLGALLSALAALLAPIVWIGEYMLDSLLAGLGSLLDPGRLYHTFVRSGWIPSVNYRVNTWETIELAMLEVFPLAGALLTVPVLGANRLRDRWRRDRAVSDAELSSTNWNAVDALVLAMALVFLLVYLPLLPLHSMVTLRYIVPAMPLVLYGVCRLAPVRRAVSDAGRTLAGGYLVTLAAGIVLAVVGLTALDPAVGEALQLHALVGLVTAAVAALAVVTWPVHRDPRTVAVGLAIPAAATTVFLLSSALWHFQFGTYALDLARVIAETLPAIG